MAVSELVPSAGLCPPGGQHPRSCHLLGWWLVGVVPGWEGKQGESLTKAPLILTHKAFVVEIFEMGFYVAQTGFQFITSSSRMTLNF